MNKHCPSAINGRVGTSGPVVCLIQVVLSFGGVGEFIEGRRRDTVSMRPSSEFIVSGFLRIIILESGALGGNTLTGKMNSLREIIMLFILSNDLSIYEV